MIYEVAQSGAMGNIIDVEKIGLYEFMSYMSYMKAQIKYNELSAKRSEANRKAKGRGRN